MPSITCTRAAYIGVTKNTLKIEAFRRLTRRGAAPQKNGKQRKGRNRPVWRWPNGTAIFQNEAIYDLEGKLMINVS